MTQQHPGARLLPGERIDDLQRGGLRIIQREDGFRFGTDAVLLADFASPRRGERVADMAARSVALNGLCARIRVHAVDCREASKIIGAECVQLCVTNPPYTRQGAGLVSPQKTRALSRSDGEGCTLGAWMSACARVLQNGGRLCVVFPSPRLLELCDAMREAHVEPKRVRMVASGMDRPPRLVLLEGRKRGRPGLHILPPLITHEADGGFSAEMRRIYGEP